MRNDSLIPATRFADPTVDFAFKRIFGTEAYKQNTVNLLNAVIPDIGIVDVKFINNELVGETADSRKSVIDVCCEDASGKKFIIEMQRASQEHFRERTLFYASKFIALLGRAGDWDYRLPPVYVVSVLDFPLGRLDVGNLNGRYLLHYTLQDTETFEKMSGGTEFFFLGLRDFEKSGRKFANDIEKWIYLLKNSSSLKEIPGTFKGDAKFSSYFEACDRAGFTRDEELQYVKDMMTRNDIENSKREACARAKAEGKAEGRSEGKAEGLAEGLAEGAEQKQREVARKMKAEGIPAETITKCTGLTAEEVEAL